MISLIFANVLFSEEKFNVAIMQFETVNLSPIYGQMASDFFRAEIVNANLFNVIERDQVQQILEEQRFQLQGLTDPNTAVKMGKLLNVQKMFIGTISKLEDKYYITMRLVDIENGKIIYSDKIKSETVHTLPEKAKELAGMFIKYYVSGEFSVDLKKSYKLKFRGMVVLIKNDKEIVINQGRLDDVKKGFIYNIMNPTGEKVVARIVVRNVNAEFSKCELVWKKFNENILGFPIKFCGREININFGINLHRLELSFYSIGGFYINKKLTNDFCLELTTSLC